MNEKPKRLRGSKKDLSDMMDLTIWLWRILSSEEKTRIVVKDIRDTGEYYEKVMRALQGKDEDVV